MHPFPIKIAEDGSTTVTVTPTEALAAFLLENVDAPEIWEACRVVLSGERTSAACSGGAAPLVLIVHRDAVRAD